jgi:ATP-dependent helicase HrpB
MVAVEAAERRERSGSGRYLVTLASAIEPDWLIDLPGDYLRETIEAKWNASAERVEVVERMVYDQLVVDERRASDANHPEVRRVLAEAAVAAGWSRFVDPDEVYRFLWRIAFIGWNFPELEMTDLGESDIEHALTDLCAGRRSFAELRQAAGRGGLVNALRQRIPPAKQHLLNSLAPETVNLPGRRNVRINYERDQAPWIASRLQDFIGMKEGPRIGGGRVALVLHLLAPNNRPVQVTTDLAGFWQRTYPGVRRELSRRYPRHAWPE